MYYTIRSLYLKIYVRVLFYINLYNTNWQGRKQEVNGLFMQVLEKLLRNRTYIEAMQNIISRKFSFFTLTRAIITR